jgi:hypothetical protein
MLGDPDSLTCVQQCGPILITRVPAIIEIERSPWINYRHLYINIYRCRSMTHGFPYHFPSAAAAHQQESLFSSSENTEEQA